MRGHITSKNELISQFIDVCHRDTKMWVMCKRMVKSMPERVMAGTSNIFAYLARQDSETSHDVLRFKAFFLL